MSKENAQEVVEVLANNTNTGVDVEELRNQFAGEHRYLQNEIFFEVVKPIIEELATDGGMDERNRNATLDAREIATRMEWR